MEDDDAKLKAAHNKSAVKPGAFPSNGSNSNVDSNERQVQEKVEESSISVPNRLNQAEQDLASKQGVSRSNVNKVTPGAVPVVNRATTQMPGVVQATAGASSSRLAAKVRGIVPENWNDVAPVATSLQSKEDQYKSKIRDAEPTVNSSLMSREEQLESKLREADPSAPSSLMSREEQLEKKLREADPSAPSSLMSREEQLEKKIRDADSPSNAALQEREDKLDGKIRANDNTVTPGALARLSNFEDSVTSKQDSNSRETHPVTLLQQREDITNTKRGQVNALLHMQPPSRLLESETMLDTKIRENPDTNVNSNMKSAVDEEMEYGEYRPSEANLTVAQPVDVIDEDIYRQAAVEYDPDAKPPVYKSRRFVMYAGIVICAVIIGTVGAILGFTLTSDDKDPPSIKYRETLGIRENIELIIENKESLDDLSSPYRKALDWIMFDDPMALTPDMPKLTQRFAVAYIYFATSQVKPWSFGCGPPQYGEKDKCSYFAINSLESAMKKGGTRWLTNTDECEWGGISCDDFSQIREVDLNGANLAGTFPDGLTMLPYLQGIRLPHGSLTGTLPDHLSDFKHLINIQLENNTFSGTVPNSWIESRRFHTIFVARNNLTGTVHPNLSNIKNLNQLDISYNHIFGAIPEEIGEVSNLHKLKLNNNLLNGTIPGNIGRLTSAHELYLFGNKLSGTIPYEIGSISLLNHLRLQSNQLSGTIPETLWGLDKLYALDLFENFLNGTISNAISRLTDLAYMNINNNQFSGSFPSRLGTGNKKLIKVEATGNNFNGTVPDEVCKARDNGALDYLGLDCGMQTGGGAPEIFCPVGCCTFCCNAEGTNCMEV